MAWTPGTGTMPSSHGSPGSALCREVLLSIIISPGTTALYILAIIRHM